MTIGMVESSFLSRNVLDKAHNVLGEVTGFIYGDLGVQDDNEAPAFFETTEVGTTEAGQVIRPDYLVLKTALGTHLALVEDVQVAQ